MIRTVIGSIAAMVLLVGTLPGVAAMTKATPDGIAATGPLAARIGGSKVSFETKYGLAVAGVTIMANTAVYNLDGFGQVAVVIDDGAVVAISAIADRADPTSLVTPDGQDWSVVTATRLATSFLPGDATYRANPTPDEGKVTGECHSEALAKVIGRSVMAKLGAKGNPGDCSYMLTEDARGAVSAFTVTIGNASGTVAKHCSDFVTQAEAQAYFNAAGGDDSPEGRALDGDHDGTVCESLK